MTAELTDGRIVLRPSLPADLVALEQAALETRDDLIKWMKWDADAFEQPRLAAWIARNEDRRRRGTSFQFFIFSVEDGGLLGSINLERPEAGDVEIGYWIRPSARMRGVVTAAIRLLSVWASKTLGLDELLIKTDPENVSSRAAALKSGATYVGDVTHSHDDGEVHVESVYRLRCRPADD